MPVRRGAEAGDGVRRDRRAGRSVRDFFVTGESAGKFHQLFRATPIPPKTHPSSPVARADPSKPSELPKSPKSPLRPPPLRRVDLTKLAPKS